MALSRCFRLARLGLVFALALALLPGSPATLAREVHEEIFEQAASLRGLAPKSPVPFAFVDGQQVRQDLLKSFEKENTVDELEISRKLLVILGLLSPDTDLHGLLLDLYAENIEGYYNREDKKMFLVSGKSEFGPVEKVTLAHEFTHALQDQYFDLGKLREGTEDNGDQAAAVTALIEGDATLTMILWARKHLTQEEFFQLAAGSDSESSLDRAPLVIRDEVLFPYSEGTFFVQRLHLSGGFEAVNKAFGDPPRSTEQIMHPEKYLAREQPIEVVLPDLAAALGPEWKELRSDVLGELDVRILIEQFGEPDQAAKVAEGWGGDRYVFLENAAGQNALVMSTVWDSKREADEFFAGFSGMVTRRYGGRARRVEEAPGRIVWATPSGAILLRQEGERVVAIMGPAEKVVNALLAALSPAPVPATPRPVPVQLPR